MTHCQSVFDEATYRINSLHLHIVYIQAATSLETDTRHKTSEHWGKVTSNMNVHGIGCKDALEYPVKKHSWRPASSYFLHLREKKWLSADIQSIVMSKQPIFNTTLAKLATF